MRMLVSEWVGRFANGGAHLRLVIGTLICTVKLCISNASPQTLDNSRFAESLTKNTERAGFEPAVGV